MLRNIHPLLLSPQGVVFGGNMNAFSEAFLSIAIFIFFTRFSPLPESFLSPNGGDFERYKPGNKGYNALMKGSVLLNFCAHMPLVCVKFDLC